MTKDIETHSAEQDVIPGISKVVKVARMVTGIRNWLETVH